MTVSSQSSTRSGQGLEHALSNSLVLGNMTRNFSRVSAGPGDAPATTATIAYGTLGRQLHAMPLEAPRQGLSIARQPASYLVQTAQS